MGNLAVRSVRYVRRMVRLSALNAGTEGDDPSKPRIAKLRRRVYRRARADLLGRTDSLRRYAVERSVQVTGYEPQVTDRRDGIALHAVCVTLAGRFGDLLRTTHALEHCLAFCRVRSMAWTVRTDRRTKRKDLILTLYVEQLVTDRQ